MPTIYRRDKRTMTYCLARCIVHRGQKSLKNVSWSTTIFLLLKRLVNYALPRPFRPRSFRSWIMEVAQNATFLICFNHYALRTQMYTMSGSHDKTRKRFSVSVYLRYITNYGYFWIHSAIKYYMRVR